MIHFATNNAPVEQPIEERTNSTPQPVDQRLDTNTSVLDPNREANLNDQTLAEQAEKFLLRNRSTQGSQSDIMQQLSNQNLNDNPQTKNINAINSTASQVGENAFEQALKYAPDSGITGPEAVKVATEAAQLARHHSVTFPGRKNSLENSLKNDGAEKDSAEKDNLSESQKEAALKERQRAELAKRQEAESIQRYAEMKERLTNYRSSPKLKF